MIEPVRSPDADESQATNLTQEDVRDIQAVTVHMHQSAASNVKATRVHARQTAMAAVDASEVLAERSALGYVQAEKASVSGYIGAVAAQTAEVRNALSAVVVGQDLHIEETRTVLLIGTNVQGNVTTLMDARSALTVGLVAGLFSGLMLLLGRMLFGRK